MQISAKAKGLPNYQLQFLKLFSTGNINTARYAQLAKVVLLPATILKKKKKKFYFATTTQQ